MLVFYDERYRSVLNLPQSAHRQTFSGQEVGWIRRDAQRAASSAGDCRVLRASSYADRIPGRGGEALDRSEVGLLLPEYPRDLVNELGGVLGNRAYTPVVLPWPLSADLHFVRSVSALDWLVFDCGDAPEGAVALGWLDARGVPFARLRRLSQEISPVPAAEAALYRAFEVGYDEDRLTWSDRADLVPRFETLVDVVNSPVLRINTKAEAETYFRAAERRKQKVFLSYASENANVAAALANKLKQRFEVVFDYRDGESLVAGSGYPAQLYDRLECSEIGIPVLSEPYLNKGTCTHEAQDMCSNMDGGKMFVYPINVDGCKPPSYFRSVQFDAVGEGDSTWNSSLTE